MVTDNLSGEGVSVDSSQSRTIWFEVVSWLCDKTRQLISDYCVNGRIFMWCLKMKGHDVNATQMSNNTIILGAQTTYLHVNGE